MNGEEARQSLPDRHADRHAENTTGAGQEEVVEDIEFAPELPDVQGRRLTLRALADVQPRQVAGWSPV